MNKDDMTDINIVRNTPVEVMKNVCRDVIERTDDLWELSRYFNAMAFAFMIKAEQEKRVVDQDFNNM